jgi:hypothetical protein
MSKEFLYDLGEELENITDRVLSGVSIVDRSIVLSARLIEYGLKASFSGWKDFLSGTHPLTSSLRDYIIKSPPLNR